MEEEGGADLLWSRDEEVCVSGCTVGPSGVSWLGLNGSVFVLADGGGVRVGYFRPVLLADSLLDVFPTALEPEDPIVCLRERAYWTCLSSIVKYMNSFTK